MPIIKQRPHIIQLLNVAVEQRTKLIETRTEILQRPASIWLNQNQSQRGSEKTSEKSKRRKAVLLTQTERKQILRAALFKYIIYWSRLCQKVVSHEYVGYFRFLIWPLAFAVMAYEAPQQDLQINNNTDYIFYCLDILITSWFAIDSFLRFSGLFIRVKTELAFNREVTAWDVFNHSGCLDIIVTIICFSYGISPIGLWFRLIRLLLITSSILDFVPHLDVLMSCIQSGMHSVFFTIVLLFLLICSYASICMFFFAENDPWHFGNYPISMFTLFQMTTFENWSQVYYINCFGCDSIPGTDYLLPMVTHPTLVHTHFGDVLTAACLHPKVQPIAATLIFISFEFFTGYVIVAMCLAAVAIGISERLDSLRTLSVYGQDDDDNDGKTKKGNIDNNARSVHQGKAGKLLGGNKVDNELRDMLEKVWEGKDDGVKPKGIQRRDSIVIENVLGAFNLRMPKLSLARNSVFYVTTISGLIVADACLEIYDESSKVQSNIGHIVLQSLLLVDACYGLKAYIHSPLEALNDYWLMFDIIVSLLVFLVLAAPDAPILGLFAALRIFRTVRVIKTLSAKISDLRVLLEAIANAFLCLLYVAILILIFFLYFALAGVLLFKNANPAYFSSISNSMQTLLQLMTMDNWSSVMRICMYGCRHYGGISGVAVHFDSMCENVVDTTGMGWWAPLYFVSFIVISAQVLTSLLIGVIITSMELLREGVNEEKEIWRHIKIIQKKYTVTDTIIECLQKIFEKLDGNNNGTLSFQETKPVMSLVNISNNDQFAFFMKVDTNRSGQLDFPEFCEMMILMGKVDGKILKTAGGGTGSSSGDGKKSIRRSIEAAVGTVAKALSMDNSPSASSAGKIPPKTVPKGRVHSASMDDHSSSTVGAGGHPSSLYAHVEAGEENGASIKLEEGVNNAGAANSNPSNSHRLAKEGVHNAQTGSVGNDSARSGRSIPISVKDIGAFVPPSAKVFPTTMVPAMLRQASDNNSNMPTTSRSNYEAKMNDNNKIKVIEEEEVLVVDGDRVISFHDRSSSVASDISNEENKANDIGCTTPINANMSHMNSNSNLYTQGSLRTVVLERDLEACEDYDDDERTQGESEALTDSFGINYTSEKRYKPTVTAAVATSTLRSSVSKYVAFATGQNNATQPYLIDMDDNCSVDEKNEHVSFQWYMDMFHGNDDADQSSV